MSDFLLIGQQLAAAYRRKAGLENDRLITAAEIEGRKVAITPEGGWPGGNEQARKAAEAVTCAADDTLRYLNLRARDLQGEIGLLQGEIDALEAERRGMEWHAQFQQVLSGVSLAQNMAGGPKYGGGELPKHNGGEPHYGGEWYGGPNPWTDNVYSVEG